MRQYEENGIRIIEADSGSYVTNGKTYSDKVYLGKNASASEWHDATADEYAQWQAMYDVEVDDDANADAITRYANTLTGANDQTLIEAAETMCIKLSEED